VGKCLFTRLHICLIVVAVAVSLCSVVVRRHDDVVVFSG
jgi:hypothetical protein